jgi:hypothetical protein
MTAILFLLRLLSALLLLGFIGLIFWLIYQDMRTTARVLASQERPFGYLRVIANDGSQPALDTRFPLYPLTRIGRANSCTIVLDSSFVSNEHAVITRRGEQWWLEDAGSRNGTLLNEVGLDEAAVITVGDVISIGELQLKVEL